MTPPGIQAAAGRSLRTAFRAAFSTFVRAWFSVVPPRNWVVLSGVPTVEENAFWLLDPLRRTPVERIVVVDDDVATAERVANLIAPLAADDPRVTFASRRSPRGLLAFLMAETVYYTHSLYGSPPSGRRRVHVNLWHGNGPKRTENPVFTARSAADLFIANTGTWGRVTAGDLGIDAGRVRVVGNPREDAFRDPPPRAALGALGIDAARPVVLWLPTYRRTRGMGDRDWTDGTSMDDDSLHGELVALASLSAARSVQLVVKPHPQDAFDYAAVGATVLTDAEIMAAGLTLYRLLPLVDGLISDYSSVWVEYLTLDRPLLLFCPDLRSYEASRGFNEPSLRTVASSLVVETAAATEQWFADVDAGLDPGTAARHAVAAALRIAPPGDRGDAVVRSANQLLPARRQTGAPGPVSADGPARGEEPPPAGHSTQQTFRKASS